MARPILNADELRYAQILKSWRERRGMTKKALADAMVYDPSRVSHVEGGRQPPTEEFTRQAESVLQTGGELSSCWEAIASGRFGIAARAPERDLRTTPFLAWLADHSDASFQALYAAVCTVVARIDAEPPSVRYAREHARRQVSRAQLASRVRHYYGEPGDGVGYYRATVGDTDVVTSMLTRAGWLRPRVTLGTSAENVRYVPTPPWDTRVGDIGMSAAVHRLAGVEVNGTVMWDNPLYRLLAVDIAPGQLSATVTTVPFAEHALTTELMEGETLDAIASGTDDLPLRDTYLPTIGSAFALEDRACVGGPVALLAIARRRQDAPPDYVIFTQERSANVLNLAGKLAVVPKGFHQPTGEPADEARLYATLRREFEEELLGRKELEQLSRADRHHVDPLHAQHLTEPMAWLLDHSDSHRMECTGLGFNLVTGNYEFACLIVIEDESWWHRFGHLVETNWEAERVHRFSSLDTDGIEALVSDPRWGNESLFSLLQGLHRLDEVGEQSRLALPEIEARAAARPAA